MTPYSAIWRSDISMMTSNLWARQISGIWAKCYRKVVIFLFELSNVLLSDTTKTRKTPSILVILPEPSKLSRLLHSINLIFSYVSLTVTRMSSPGPIACHLWLRYCITLVLPVPLSPRRTNLSSFLYISSN